MQDVHTVASRYSYPETIARLSGAIVAAGNAVFLTLDQSAAADGVGLTLRPTTLIVFGNPKGGTPLMEAYPLVALELPLKLLVWETTSGVSVGYVSMHAVARRYGIADDDARIAAMDRALVTLSHAISDA